MPKNSSQNRKRHIAVFDIDPSSSDCFAITLRGATLTDFIFFVYE